LSDDSPPKLIVESENSDIMGSSATIRVEVMANAEDVDSERFSSTALLINLTFDPFDLQMDTASLNVFPITCSFADASWGFRLPRVPAIGDGYEEVTIAFEPSNASQRLFSFNPETNYVGLTGSTRLDLMNGELCPEETSVDLPFKITSD
jgi:hypothetical protein